MTQEILEVTEAIDQELHGLALQPLSNLTELNMMEQLSYTDMLINKLFRLMLKEKIGGDNND